MHPWKHFKTITYHRYLVMKGCFRVGLYRQGLMHDLSKYSPSEFWMGAIYYQGTQSPNNAERAKKGYSSAWLHHKGRNKHHYEYWIDYSTKAIKTGYVPVEMPKKYVAEMIMDRIAASKVYNGKSYQDDMPLKYFLRGKEIAPIHENTKVLMEDILTILANKGEKEAFSYVKKILKNDKLESKQR